jgi:uncharacterized membrane protein
MTLPAGELSLDFFIFFNYLMNTLPAQIKNICNLTEGLAGISHFMDF